jgi:hypothetical protein
VVETTDSGWAVYGYSNSSPYFPIVVSAAAGKLQTISAGGATVQVPAQYTNNVVKIPYGYVFTNRTMMVDFLLSYGQYLQAQGLRFTQLENGYTLDWPQMAQEFLYYSQQGWQTGTLINLNPAAGQLEAGRVGAVVDNIFSYSPENMLLDQNRQTFATRNLIIQRDGDSFKINPEPTAGQAISFLNLKFTDYEHILVFDNETIFNDLKKNYSNSVVLLKKNWLKVWKGRMKYNKIKNDAENVEIKNNFLISIGNKITNKLPKYQYMGIIKLKKKDFFKLKNFFVQIKNNKIDFTSFLDKAIKSKIIKIKVMLTSKFWYEIDNAADIKFTEKNLW